MRVASIDVGTNTALLLIADVRADGTMDCIREDERFIRLGEGVDATRVIGDAALNRLSSALELYAAVIAASDVEQTVVVGTSASRDARNGHALEEIVRRTLGVSYEIITGEEEALRTFAGALSSVGEIEGPCAVVDVGGGSTEIVIGSMTNGASKIEHHVSTDLGGVRLTERFFASAPPGKSEVQRMREHIDDTLASVGLLANGDLTLVGTSGTARSLAMMASGVTSWSQVGRASLTLERDEISDWAARLLTLTTPEVLGLSPALMGGRADVFPCGVLILERVMDRLEAQRCVVSRGGLKEGVALHAARNNRI